MKSNHNDPKYIANLKQRILFAPPSLNTMLTMIENLNWTWGMGNSWGIDGDNEPTEHSPATKRWAMVRIWPHPDQGDWGPYAEANEAYTMFSGEYEDSSTTEYPDGATLRDALQDAFIKALDRAIGYWSEWEARQEDGE